MKVTEIESGMAARIRASILLAGPMLARVGRMVLPPPGGDVIGRRRVDTHFLALAKLGATVDTADGYHLETKGLKGADIFLDEPSVTGTENAVMAAVTAKGHTKLRNAAAEPHVQDLCAMLIKMGAQISGVGTGVLEIDGVDKLNGCTHRIGSDHIEVGSFIGLAAVTRGAITIEDAAIEHLDSTLLGFERMGVHCEPRGKDLFVGGRAGDARAHGPGRTHSEDRRRPLAGVSRRPDVDRARRGDTVPRHDPDLREDVRVAHVLRRQANQHGRAHRSVRPAPRGRGRTVAAARGVSSKAPTFARAWRC